jgi:hypothetical protein
MGEATFTRTDGTTGAALDVMLAYQPGQAAMSEQANINRMALLFNNAVNTAVDIELPSLGYVPIGMESADPHVQDFASLQGEHSNKT